MSRLRPMLLGLSMALVSGCSGVHYYTQSITGHLGLMGKRVPIETLLKDPETRPALRRQLALARRVRLFATEQLKLPDNESYHSYAEIDAPFVIWNVVATEEFSVKPFSWCYPIVGCLSYRGYYDYADAEQLAKELRARGDDVFVGGVRAYSTLGWFDDPVLSTMLTGSETYLAGVVFHELAHQVVYLRGDATFNESFAVAVERAGVRRWLASEARVEDIKDYNESERRADRFVSLMLEARESLSALYAEGGDVEGLRRRKAQIMAALRVRFRAQRDEIGEQYAPWFGDDLNNAHFALVATYHDYVEGFERMLQDKEDWAVVFRNVQALGKLPREERDRLLRSHP